MGQVLIVDDEASIGWALREALGDDGHRVELSASAEEGLRRAEATRPDALVMDVRLPGMDGLAALRVFRERFGPMPVVVMTAFGDLETAVRAVEAGAFEYLIKPFDLDRAAEVIGRAIASAGYGDMAKLTDSDVLEGGAEGSRLIGSGPLMQELFKQIALVARTDVPVLITGESGTGKELVARAIHRHGGRSSGPFVPISVPALSGTLIERELFGHLRGAFTGAEADRPGLLERAAGGTVLLDEVGDVPLELQVKLLRAIEYREIVPVGGTRPRAVDVRFVAATNRPLGGMIANGSFREDLFFRLSVFPIRVAPLRERKEDLAPLALHFARSALGRRSDDERPTILADAMESLRERPWPGNVRELRNAIEYAAIVSRGGPIRVEHLPAAATRPRVEGVEAVIGRLIGDWAVRRLAAGDDANELYDHLLTLVEPPLLRSALEHCKDNRLAAAARLGMHRGTLREKLRKHGI